MFSRALVPKKLSNIRRKVYAILGQMLFWFLLLFCAESQIITKSNLYIINAAKHLRAFSPEAVICRLGGDEFMLLAQNTDYYGAQVEMESIYRNLQSDEYLKDKSYEYSISFGIVTVAPDNTKSASDLLSIADERMYESKRAKKRARKR